jgi:phage gpG-like protein
MTDIPIGSGGGPQGNAYIGFNNVMVPSLALTLWGLEEWSTNLEDVHKLLETIVDDIMIPSVHENFLQGGRPTWDELAEGTLLQKKGDAILIETGVLLDVAISPYTWVINATAGEGEVTVQSLPGAEYGYYHSTGTRFMPMREFIMFQDEDLAKIDLAMGTWVDIQTITSGFLD